MNQDLITPRDYTAAAKAHKQQAAERIRPLVDQHVDLLLAVEQAEAILEDARRALRHYETVVLPDAIHAEGFDALDVTLEDGTRAKVTVTEEVRCEIADRWGAAPFIWLEEHGLCRGKIKERPPYKVDKRVLRAALKLYVADGHDLTPQEAQWFGIWPIRKAVTRLKGFALGEKKERRQIRKE